MQSEQCESSGRRISVTLLFGSSLYAALASVALAAYVSFPDYLGELRPNQYDPLFRVMIGHGIAAVAFFIAGQIARRRSSLSTPAVRWLFCIVTLGLVISSDVLLGIAYPVPLAARSIFQRHDRRGWTHIPYSRETGLDTHAGKADIQLDRYGLRVDLWRRNREITGDRRILFLGDSIVFGYYVTAAQTFGALSVEKLNGQHPGAGLVELNAGVTGYDTGQELDLLVNEGLSLKPSLVVLGFCLNDVTRQLDSAQSPDPDRHPEFTQARPPTHWSGWVRAAFAWRRRWIYGADERATAQRVENINYADLMTAPASPRVVAAWDRAILQLDGIIESCRNHDIPLVVVVFPIKRQLSDPSANDEPQLRLATHLADRHVACLDLLPVYLAGKKPEPAIGDALYGDPIHPNALGHRLAAEALTAYLDRFGLVKELLKR